MATKRKAKPRKTRRIYYGPDAKPLFKWWDVKVSDAKQKVTLPGNVRALFKGRPGNTLACGIANLGRAHRDAFPHPMFLLSVNQTTALAVDKLNKKKDPMHAVLYRHNAGHIVDMNDRGAFKKLDKIDPKIVERPVILSPPKHTTRPNRIGPAIAPDRPPHEKKHVMRGALARAIKAGLVSKTQAVFIVESARMEE
jgi:hypothetical protein